MKSAKEWLEELAHGDVNAEMTFPASDLYELIMEIQEDALKVAGTRKT